MPIGDRDALVEGLPFAPRDGTPTRWPVIINLTRLPKSIHGGRGRPVAVCPEVRRSPTACIPQRCVNAHSARIVRCARVAVLMPKPWPWVEAQNELANTRSNYTRFKKDNFTQPLVPESCII